MMFSGNKQLFERRTNTVISFLKRFCKEEDGQDLVEYSLLLAFLALATIGLLTNARTSLNGLWGTVATSLNTANTTAAS
jgi:Flp pilus assembly pilin Flp